MKIKGTQDIYAAYQPKHSTKSIQKPQEKSGAASQPGTADIVVFSSKATLRARVETASKTYQAQQTNAVSQERLNQLKEQYRGDQCPITSRQIAEAMAQKILGMNKDSEI